MAGSGNSTKGTGGTGMQEYLLKEKEQKASIVLAMRLAESVKLRHGDDAVDFLSGVILELSSPEDVFTLICKIENS
jgi:hypothetical protein